MKGKHSPHGKGNLQTQAEWCSKSSHVGYTHRKKIVSAPTRLVMRPSRTRFTRSRRGPDLALHMLLEATAKTIANSLETCGSITSRDCAVVQRTRLPNSVRFAFELDFSLLAKLWTGLFLRPWRDVPPLRSGGTSDQWQQATTDCRC